VMKAQREVKKDPKRAIEMIEKVLEEEPYNRQGNLVLKEAAVAAGWPDIAVFALRTLLEEHPRDVKLLHELGRLYHDLGLSNEEVEVYNQIVELNPLDSEALRLGKDASARASMTSGGWTQAESYRDLIKDKDLALSLEQEGRMKSTGESLDQQIADAYERHQAEPQNVDLARKLGALNEEKGDVESAIAWYQYTVDLTNATDAGLVRRVSDLKMRRSDEAISELETFLATHGPDHELYAERAEELANARKNRDALLIEQARKRLERNPTDLQLRFELGEHLVNAGHYRDALPELQRARQNPNARLKAMNLLGRCYRELGMMDLAMKQLEEAAREIGTMDSMKKEIVYSLGLVYEKMGDREKSLSCMKQIYEADYGYKDVAERVESSYRESAPPASA
jgi:tetratricopeptide (TPR) repeat protein